MDFNDLHGFSWISEHGGLKLGTSPKERPVAFVKTFFLISSIIIDFGDGFLKTWHDGKGSTGCAYRNFARFQAGFLSCEDVHVFYSFHRFSKIFMDFIDFHRFS